VIEDETSVEYQIALRQLAGKSQNSKSWFIHTDTILKKYGLPSAHSVIMEKETVSKWKHRVRTVVTGFWETKLSIELNKSTTRFISSSSIKLDAPALLWTDCGTSPRETMKSRIKVKAVCGVLRLQVHEHLFTKGKMTNICKLCGTEVENRCHFLLKCPTLMDIRIPHLDKLLHTLTGSTTRGDISDNALIQALLDQDHRCCGITKGISPQQRALVEAISRDMIFMMYKQRLKILEQRHAHTQPPKGLAKREKRGAIGRTRKRESASTSVT
jgi:hypothetical protein